MNNSQIENKQIFYYLATHRPSAVCEIRGGEDYPMIMGSVQFFAMSKGVVVIANIDNLPKTKTNIFAFHVHEGSGCGNNFADSGGHYNPLNLEHPLHAGDMPPLFSNGGSAWQAFYTTRYDVEQIIQKTVVIHDNPDDFVSQPAGNSGKKIACGRIERA